MMSISGTCEACNCDPVQIVHELKKFVDQSVSEQTGMRDFERGLFDWLLVQGFVLTEEFLRQQGDGDCGETCEVAEKTAYRSEQPAKRRLRTIFGEHQFEAFVYRSGKHPNNRIVSRPVDDQLGIDTEQYSPLVQEFTMALCCEQAFHIGAETFETFFGQKLSVDTLERTSRIMGQQAAEFMDALSDPPVEEEGEFLVQTADCKGVPMVREDAQKLRACDPKPDRPGNRRMTTVAAVYSVDPFVRTPEEILTALFSSAKTEHSRSRKRPTPCHKRYLTKFPELHPEVSDKPMSGTRMAMVWANAQVESRRQRKQKLIRLMDGQHNLWEEADAGLAAVPPEDIVDILDLLHVAGYVWTAAKAFHAYRRDQEAFAMEMLRRILEGNVDSVIRSLRYRATFHKLTGTKRDDADRVCGYFTGHRERMKYNEYLARGYPIATGVIEGACRHIVKDRMERSGMKWTCEGARQFLHLRCLRASGYWEQFHQHRSKPSHKNQTLCA